MNTSQNIKTLILKDGTSLPILNVANSYQNPDISIVINTVVSSLEELDQYIDSFTDDNLSDCTIVDEDSSTESKKFLFYKYMKIIKRDNDYLGVFYFKTLSDYEVLKLEFEEYKNTTSEALIKLLSKS